jgi:hypothetical protein
MIVRTNVVARPRRAERVPQPSTLRRIKTHMRLSPASIAVRTRRNLPATSATRTTSPCQSRLITRRHLKQLRWLYSVLVPARACTIWPSTTIRSSTLYGSWAASVQGILSGLKPSGRSITGFVILSPGRHRCRRTEHCPYFLPRPPRLTACLSMATEYPV